MIFLDHTQLTTVIFSSSFQEKQLHALLKWKEPHSSLWCSWSMPNSKGPAVLWALVPGNIQINPMQLKAHENEIMKSAITNSYNDVCRNWYLVLTLLLTLHYSKTTCELHKIIMWIAQTWHLSVCFSLFFFSFWGQRLNGPLRSFNTIRYVQKTRQNYWTCAHLSW